MYREIKKCRICGNENLIPLVNLGRQALTGIFPKDIRERVQRAPLELVKCHGNGVSCGLVQLRHSHDPRELYGDNYGYRSALNPAMVSHLREITCGIEKKICLSVGDLVVDIGSNDGTLLKSYSGNNLKLVGIDPAGRKFRSCYPQNIRLIPEFFSRKLIRKHFTEQKAKVITSVAMFYDVESPLEFMRWVYEFLDDEGIWVLEQSYLPIMLKNNAYDTICHEHLEYYSLKQIKWLTDKAGFKIIDCRLNDINGGSLCLTIAKSKSHFRERTDKINKILDTEKTLGLDTLKPFRKFRQRVFSHRRSFLRIIKNLKSKNKTILGYGASTKGNVVLQFCHLDRKDIPFIAEINEDKVGCYTPATHIPIISEAKAKRMHPDFLLVMPWHFKETFLKKKKDILGKSGKLLFPFPIIEIL